MEEEGVRPLAIDLFCGLGGWTEGFLTEGYRVIGFDIEIRPYPAQLVLQDVLTIHGSQFKDAACIVASPPCQKYSWLAMPWSRSQDPNNSKAAKALRRKWETEGPDNRLFDACFRIQREAIEAAGRFIPMIVENVRGAVPWVGPASWSFGSFMLWGDVPALMPVNLKRASKVPGFRFDGSGGSVQTASVDHTKNAGRFDEHGNEVGSWFRRTQSGNTLQDDFRLNPEDAQTNGTKIGGDWFRDPACHSAHGSRSSARKAASAQIAKIPFELARHVAAVYYPNSLAQVRRRADAARERKTV